MRQKLKFGSVTLFDYQAEDIQRAIDEGHKSIFLAYDMALGKTITAVAFSLLTPVETVLIVGPVNTRRGWEKTVKAMSPDKNFFYLTSNKRDALSWTALKNETPGYYFIGWEMMRTVAAGLKADMIIGDEIHRIQNYGNSLTERMFRELQGEYKVALSGTPAANRPDGLFAPMHWLWPERYKSFYKHFIDKFWLTRRNGAIIDLVRERTPGSIVADMPFFVRRLKRDHRGDIPDVLPEVNVECPMTRTQTKIYKQFDEVALAWLGDNPVATSIPLTQEIRLLQAALGELHVDTEGKVSYPLDAKSSKIKTLIELVKEHEGEAFFVLTHSAVFIPAVVHQLEAAGIKVRAFPDSTKQRERDRLVETIGDEYQVLVAGIAGVAEGLDGLQHKCSNGVWLSKHPSAMLTTQAGERLDRPGQTDPVQWWNFWAPNTKEEKVLERLDETNETLAELYDNHR